MKVLRQSPNGQKAMSVWLVVHRNKNTVGSMIIWIQP